MRWNVLAFKLADDEEASAVFRYYSTQDMRKLGPAVLYPSTVQYQLLSILDTSDDEWMGDAKGVGEWADLIGIVELKMSSNTPNLSRWKVLQEETPSGNTLFFCPECGRTSLAPEKECPQGCREE